MKISEARLGLPVPYLLTYVDLYYKMPFNSVHVRATTRVILMRRDSFSPRSTFYFSKDEREIELNARWKL